MNARGLSLVELMVALAIGSLLIVGAVTVSVRSTAAYEVNESLARLQETARFALSTMELDVQLAGFWGLTGDAAHISGTIGNAPLSLPTAAARCGTEFPLDLRRPVDGTNNTYALPCAATGGAQAGSDVLVVRRADPEPVPADGDRLQIYTTRDGAGNALFLSHTAPGATGPGAEIHDLAAVAYYVSGNSTGQAGLPSLRRKVLRGGPSITDEEIMPGVEDLQIQFGIDPGVDDDGDGIVDRFEGLATRYVDPGDPALEEARTIAVRLWIRVRAEQTESGFTDDKAYEYADVAFLPAGPDAAYRRLLVTRTIHLRNAPVPLP